MRNVLLGVVIAVLAISTFYFYQEANSKTHSGPDFGQLSKVNRMVLATQTIRDSCTHEDRKGAGKGIIVYDWVFEAGYGIDVPLNYTWNVKEVEPGRYEISAPPLKQLHPIVVDFTRFIETNEASGNRWERMYGHAKKQALKRIRRATEVAIAKNPEVSREAKASAERFFGQIIANMLQDEPLESVTVKFGKPGGAGRLIKTEKC